MFVFVSVSVLGSGVHSWIGLLWICFKNYFLHESCVRERESGQSNDCSLTDMVGIIAT